MRAEKRFLQHIQIYSLVLNKGGVSAQSEVNQDTVKLVDTFHDENVRGGQVAVYDVPVVEESYSVPHVKAQVCQHSPLSFSSETVLILFIL